MLEQGVGKFEGEPDGAELPKGWFARPGQLRIHQGHSLGRGRADLMVVQHDDFDAAFAQPADGIDGGRSAIDRQQQRDREFREAILHGGLREAVAFIPAMRQVGMHGPAERGEEIVQQRGRSHAVHVVIAEDHECLSAFAGSEEALDRGAHVRQEKGIGQILEARLEKARDGFRFAELAVEEALREQAGDLQLLRKEIGKHRLGRRDGPAVFHEPSQRRISSTSFSKTSTMMKILIPR